MILTIIFIALAAVCKAIVDTIVHHGGGKLKKKFGSFFDITRQGKFLPLTKYPFDGFHVFNSATIVFFVLAITLNPVKVVILGVIFILAFNLFWNKIFN